MRLTFIVILLFQLCSVKAQNEVSIDSLFEVSYNLFYAGEIDSSYKISKEILTKLDTEQHSEHLGNLYKLQGVLFTTQGNNVRALNLLQKSLNIFEELEDSLTIASIMVNIGIVHSKAKNYNKALTYYNKSIKLKRQNNADNNSLSVVYNNMGLIFKYQNKFKEALNYFLKTLEIQKTIGNDYGVSLANVNIGSLLVEMNELDSSYAYFIKSYEIDSISGNHSAMANSLTNLGNLFFLKKDYQKSLFYLKKAKKFTLESNNIENRLNVAEVLYKLYFEIGETENYFEEYKIFKILEDSLIHLENEKEILRAELKYEWENKILQDSIIYVKEKQKQKLSRQRERFITWIVIIIILISIIFYIKGKFEEKKNLLNEIEILKSKKIVQNAISVSVDINYKLDQDKLEKATASKLNPTDLKILNILIDNAGISNKELAEEINISLEGTKSSLKKMYRIFDIPTSRNQRFSLILKAIKLSI